MVFVTLLSVLLYGAVARASPSAVAFQPSTQWYGIDGNWSAITISLGDPGQTVNVLVSTSLSELWVIQSGGCLDREPLCDTARGNVFTVDRSDSWESLGTWGVGLEYLETGGNGDYGLESLTAKTLEDGVFSIGQVLTAAINSTDYYNGLFGLGIDQGRFGSSVHDSPLTQAVTQYGQIPSYSYGYTAGAYYAGTSGVPCSLTLGGYDENRFVPHNIEFSLARNGTSPRALVRGISISTVQDGRAPPGWQSTSQQLSNMSMSFEALVDSSTPFLWLPEAVCDEFSEALGLTYNSTFNLYTINNTQFDTLLAATFSFTFSLSSFDNTDGSDEPLAAPGVVNITISAAAFAQILRYPFKDIIGYGDASIPYFPLRRTDSSTDFIIGRSFLQEAYIITKYDSGVFSIHQSRNPDDPLTDLSIKTIEQPENSTFPPPANNASGRGKSMLTAGMIAGVSVGVSIFVLILALGVWLYIYRRKLSTAPGNEEKDPSSSSKYSNPPQTPVAKILSRIVGGRKTRRPSVHEAPENAFHPAEVGAGAGHAVYELPAHNGPMELDASRDGDSDYVDTELGTGDSQDQSAYEVARRKLVKQLQGPVPPYSPPENPSAHSPLEKDALAASSPTTQQPPSVLPSVSPPTTIYHHSDSCPGSMPSPLTPRGELSMSRSANSSHGISPTTTEGSGGTTCAISPSNISLQLSRDWSHPSRESASPQSASAPLFPVTTQRAPFDASKVVCLGPLPENMLVSSERPILLGHLAGPSGHDQDDHGQLSDEADNTGSNPINLETQQPISPEQDRKHSSQQHERIDSGSEFVHVPQLAARRYSWENEGL